MRISDWSSDVCSSDLSRISSCPRDGGVTLTGAPWRLAYRMRLMPASSAPRARVPTFDSHSLAGRVAVVTGAAGGLGAAIAQRLTDKGATLVLVDQHAPNPVGLPAAEAIACDIADP